MKNKIKKIAIITTRQNYKWISMQEVLPAIERCWEMTAESLNAEAKIFNVDQEPLRNFIHYLFDCDAFIIIAFNETIARFMREVRGTLNLPVPFVLHLYGHASLGLWPQHRFNVLQVMTAGDVFIGTCPGDMNCMKLAGENLLSYDIPYPYFPLEISKIAESELKFAYIGRISDQKNIDTLIEAYALLENDVGDLPPLLIYGKEDHFGSPNMGIPSTECLKNLQAKIVQHNLSEKIIFKGFQPREELYAEIGRKHIFLSASTHSDENFGMALMRSLAQGALAVVSHWGGHIPFKNKCSDRVWSAPVHFDTNRPKCDVAAFKEQMKNALAAAKTYNFSGSLPDYFFPKEIAKSFAEILDNISFSSEELKLTSVANEMYAQQLQYESQGDMQRVFTSYDDLKAQKFLRAYS